NAPALSGAPFSFGKYQRTCVFPAAAGSRRGAKTRRRARSRSKTAVATFVSPALSSSRGVAGSARRATSRARPAEPPRRPPRAAGREVRLERRGLGRVERAERVEGEEVLELGPAHPSPPSHCGSDSRRRRSAFRARVFTVPRGVPVFAAISLCERPSK